MRGTGDEQGGASLRVWDLFPWFCGFAACAPAIASVATPSARGLVVGAIETSPDAIAASARLNDPDLDFGQSWPQSLWVLRASSRTFAAVLRRHAGL